jgi:NAD(P)-dependent dehydrogenase (short-subunit alcohol dehydrogenase family)
VADGFAGKLALVTGAGSGMGKAFALALAGAGARVAVCGRRPDPLAETVAEVEAAGGEAFATSLDVRDADGVEAWVEAAAQRYGPPEVLVNNAAGNFICPAIELTPNGWRAVVDIVLNGTFFCSTAVARRMRDSGRGGTMLNVVASYATTGHPGTAHSAAAKAGVWNLTKTLAVEWAPLGIRVNAIAPGPIETPGATAHLFPTEEIRRLMIEQIPAGRFGTLEDVV